MNDLNALSCYFTWIVLSNAVASCACVTCSYIKVRLTACTSRWHPQPGMMSELVTVADESCIDADGCLMGSILASQHAVCRLIVRYLTEFREDSAKKNSYLENRELCVCVCGMALRERREHELSCWHWFLWYREP